MSKKLCFLMSFVLALALIGTARAEPIDVNNHSFEYDVDGNQITELTGWDDVKGWTMRDNTFAKVPGDIGDGFMGGWQYVDDEWGTEGFEAADGSVCSFNVTADDPNDPNFSCQIIQILEDPCAVIAANRRYTLTFNALRIVAEDTPTVYGALFHTTGVNVVPVNDVTLASEMPFLLSPPWGESDYAGWEEVTVSYTALPGAGSLGETLGIKLSAPIPWLDGYQVALDNVRVKWEWATDAWDPDPADGADDVPMDVNLSWSPGLWTVDVNGHEVYFGTSWADVNSATTATAGIYRGPDDVTGPDGNNRYSYDVLETLELGKIYYWRVDEVNEAYVGPPAAAPDANGRWKGDIWSFRTTGLAYNIYPKDWAAGVPALNLLLQWTAGTDSNSHDVYFGTDKAEVTDANTANTAMYPGVFRGNQPPADVNYALEDLGIERTYYWRIDEVNIATGTLVTGDVWRFTTGVFLNVDTFNWYVDTAALRDAWIVSHLTGNGAELFIEQEPNLVRDVRGGGSMRFAYRNSTYNSQQGTKYYYGSEAEAALPLEIGTDWTEGGGRALVLYFFGDANNGETGEYEGSYHIANDQMYVAVVDGVNEGVVKYDPCHGYDMNDIKEESWQEWNISLQDPCLVAVDMNNVTKVYIGFGGQKTGQINAPGAGTKSGNFDTVWFDDIRLYPPRCIPSFMAEDYLHDLGDFDSDCRISFSDLEIMANDWNLRGQWIAAAPPAGPPEVWYRFDDGPGSTTVKNDGSWGGYDISIGSPNEADEPNWTTDAAPALDPCDPNYALDFDGLDDWVAIPALNLNSNTITITAWVKPVMAGGGNQNIYSAIAYCGGDANSTDSGIVFGADTSTWLGNNEVCYMWGGLYWDWHTDLFFVDSTWNFVAMAVEPTKATIYLYDGTDFASWTNDTAHDAEEFDGVTNVGWVPHPDEIRAVDGIIDDVRIYNKTLSISEVMAIAGLEGVSYVPLNSDVDLVVGDKDPCYPDVDDQIDFKDYGVLAKHWLEYEQHLWP